MNCAPLETYLLPMLLRPCGRTCTILCFPALTWTVDFSVLTMLTDLAPCSLYGWVAKVQGPSISVFIGYRLTTPFRRPDVSASFRQDATLVLLLCLARFTRLTLVILAAKCM